MNNHNSISNYENSISSNYERIFEPPRWRLPDFKEIWHFRELILFLTFRDLKTNYGRTALTYAWAFIPPLFNLVLNFMLFGMLARLSSEGVPYVLFLIVGQAAWGIISGVFSAASNSLQNSAALTAKVYFPRLIVTFYSTILALINTFPLFLILIFLLVWYKVSLTWSALFIPIFILIAIITAMAVGLWITSLSVQYRDIAQVSGMLLTIWLYSCPVIYSPEVLPEGILQTVYWLNPAAVVVQGFRWSLLGLSFPPPVMVTVSMLIVVLLFVFGLLYFQRVEQTVIDMV